MAARSLTLTARARCPMAAGGVNARSKWMPSTMASTVSTSRRFRAVSTTAASSPTPTTSQSGAGGSRARILAISSRSESWETEAGGSRLVACAASPPPPAWSFGIVDGPRFADDRDLDLTGILELALDAAGDVFRQPDRLLVGDVLALHHDADLAAGLQRERLRDTLERVGDALELLEPLHVRLQDVAPGAGARGRDGVGRLHDHRFERGPVDVHV